MTNLVKFNKKLNQAMELYNNYNNMLDTPQWYFNYYEKSDSDYNLKLQFKCLSFNEWIRYSTDPRGFIYDSEKRIDIIPKNDKYEYTMVLTNDKTLKFYREGYNTEEISEVEFNKVYNDTFNDISYRIKVQAHYDSTGELDYNIK